MLDISDIFPMTTPEEERRRLLRVGSTSLPPGAATPPPAAGGYDVAGLRRRADDAYQRAIEGLDATPDLGPWKQYAQQRSQQGGRQLLLALAAQQAGKEFQPLASQFLQKAMAARDPVQVGKAGMITGDGEFVADPYYQREKQAEMFLKRAEALEKAAVSAQTAEESAKARAEAQRAREDYQRTMAGFREQSLEIQRQGLAMRGEAADRSARDRADREDDRRRQGDERRIDSIRKEFNARMQKVQDGASFANDVVRALADPGIVRNAPAQVALVMQFGKMLDPDSVVREAEQRMIANARGLADSLTQMIPKLQTGAFLTPQQLEQMRQVANQYVMGSRTRGDDLKALYVDLAQRNGLRPEDVVLGHRAGGAVAAPEGAVRERGAPAPVQTPSPAGGPPPGAVREKAR